VVWEICFANVASGQVRVTDGDLQKVFYEYEEDEILRVEMGMVIA
jgi:hypothetical protein